MPSISRGRGWLLTTAVVVPTTALVLGSAATASAAPVSAPEATVVAAKYKNNGKFKVKAPNFGQHSSEVKPGTSSGSLRFTSPTWREVQPTQNGPYVWTGFDATVNNARSWGYSSNMMHAFYGTPFWAGSNVKQPAVEIGGPRSASAPTNMNYWRDYVTAVVKRYKGKIKYYQTWNEATSPQFYQGTPKQMATMTKILYQVVRKYDKKAKVVSASAQTHRKSWYQAFMPKYLKALKKAKWPVNAIAGHFYPNGNGGPNQRLKQIDMFNKTLDKYKVPSKVDRMDTEVNYDLRGPGSPGAPNGRITGNKAATYVARTYLDGWRRGLQNQYWFMWTSSYDFFPGIQMYQNSQPGVKAYNNLVSWTKGGKFNSCSTKGKLVTCNFKKGKSFKVMFTQKGKAKVRLSGKTSVCPVSTGQCKKTKGTLKVTTLPVRVG